MSPHEIKDVIEAVATFAEPVLEAASGPKGLAGLWVPPGPWLLRQ